MIRGTRPLLVGQGPGLCRPGTLLGVTILAGVREAVVKLIGAQEERRGLWIQKAGGSWGTEVSRPGKD